MSTIYEKHATNIIMLVTLLATDKGLGDQNKRLHGLDVMMQKQRKVKKPAVAGSRTQDTSGLSRQCSATEPQQPDNHQPSQSSICTAQSGTECFSRTPGSHPVCAVRTPLVVDWKILSIRKKPMLSGLLTLKTQSI